MTLVLDPSVVAGWYMADESSPYALAARAAVVAEGALVPGLWPYEVTNMLLMAERRRRISQDDVALALESLAAMPIALRPATTMPHALGLARFAREHGLSAYDASYLEAAVQTRSRLATLDRDLRRAAERAGVPLFSN